MQVRFFLGMNNIISHSVAMPDDMPYSERCKQILARQFEVLKALVREASQVEEGILPVVVCGEDFFHGGKVATKDERDRVSGKCMDRDMVFAFFASQLKQLSRDYSSVLIIPGSVYVSQDAGDNDHLTYKQENQSVKHAKCYVQNIMPVFYKGEWLRLVKKGDYLKLPLTKMSIKTEAEFTICSQQKQNAVVPKYAEDNLSDINDGLVFFGATPLPGEKQLMEHYQCRGDFFNPVVTVEGIRIGLEICGDHASGRLKQFLTDHEESVDLHIISSCGIGSIYNAGMYRIQVDAESESLTGITHKTESDSPVLHKGRDGVVLGDVLLDIDLVKSDVPNSLRASGLFDRRPEHAKTVDASHPHHRSSSKK